MTHAIRPPFIWSPRQPIDLKGPAAVFLGKRRARERNRWFLFRRTFELKVAPTSAELAITCDGRYQLFANAGFVGRGPVRCSPLFQRFDSYDLKSHLRTGPNIIGVLVHTYGVDTAFYETTQGMWQPTFGDGGLWCEGAVDDGQVTLDSSEDWRCLETPAWGRDLLLSEPSDLEQFAAGFIEDFDANLFPANWLQSSFSDAHWDHARALVSGGGGPEARLGGMEVRPFPVLIPRGIPVLTDYRVAAQRVVWVRALRPDPTLPPVHRPYREAFLELEASLLQKPDDLLKLQAGEAVLVTRPDRDVTILLDFGRIMTGRPWFDVEAHGGEVIEIVCAECLPGEWSSSGLSAEARPTPRHGMRLETNFCRYTARGGRQTFERFEWGAVRWMQIVIRNAPAGVRFHGLGVNVWNYPVETRGRFQSSDPLLDRLWTVGAYTLRQCMHDAWEDCPSREQRQWLGDVAVENLVGWAAFGPSVAALTAKFLEQAAESQRPDGLTQMFAPGDHKTNGNLIPDWTLHWILVAGDHWRLSGDLQTIRRIFPSILKALAWFEHFIGPSGLLADLPYWRFIDWAGVGRDGESATLNAQLAGAYKTAAMLANALKWNRERSRLVARARNLAAALQKRHWDPRRRVYVDVVDPMSGMQEPRVSQHANAAIALWCKPPARRISQALNRITDEARLTFTAAPPIVPAGQSLDPEEGVVMANTFFSHFVLEALARQGRVVTVMQQIRRRFGPMIARGATTLWESFEPTGSLCHGFSTSPTYQLSRHVLGVSPGQPGFRTIDVQPHLGDLSDAQGTVPTPHGDVTVELHRHEGQIVAQVVGPPAIPLALRHGSQVLAQCETGGHLEARFEPPKQSGANTHV